MYIEQIQLYLYVYTNIIVEDDNMFMLQAFNYYSKTEKSITVLIYNINNKYKTIFSHNESKLNLHKDSEM